jgi:alpha-tubulin suppressor-like RCC1 family protein
LLLLLLLLLLPENGHVYTWGRDGSGELGHGNKSGVPQLHPKQVIFFKSKCVREVVCGGEHTLARTGTRNFMFPNISNFHSVNVL